MNKQYPVIDLHCDLLEYLQRIPGSDPFEKGKIGCSFPALAEGNVALQVLAIFTKTEKGSSRSALQQSRIFKDLVADHQNRLMLIKCADDIETALPSNRIGILAAIENASGFCEEEDSLDDGFMKLEEIISNTEKVLYISLTHHEQNRFGGGNNSTAGLKEDGKVLLDYIDGKKIAIDFSHTSDALAIEILAYHTKKSLDIPLIASHSNYREIFYHQRNLPDELAKEINSRKGLIGINFLRAFINDRDSNAMYDHIDYGLKLGGADSICFGADFCDTASHPDQSRKPFYFEEQKDASCYPSILNTLSGRISKELVEGISHKNVLDFIRRIYD